MRIADFAKGQQIGGLVHGQSVTLIAVEPMGEGAVNLIYRNSSGRIGERLIASSGEAESLAMATESRPWNFTADAEEFKLVAEAHRIHLAHLFDPMMAVHTSSIMPLPHQISAVYEVMLPRQPLRFLLADDPGAGKTIMAGLLIKELMVRGDASRCLIVSPGSLVEQWQDELSQKFGLAFEVFSREMVEASGSGNPFAEKNYLICRVDQLSRAEDLQEKIGYTEWDLIIVDEAHKMSIRFYGSKEDPTQRYRLGQMLGKLTRNLLLMTATPHNGNEESFNGFLALLDPDRFYGKIVEKDGKVDTSDIMRRMIKEDLKKFDGTNLFPPREAKTAAYNLSEPEQSLYESVTEYVTEQMGKADQLDGKRRGTVGFALTVLQRRLASSPEAIYQSLKRRRERLEERLEKERAGSSRSGELSETVAYDQYEEKELDDYIDEAPDEELEAYEETLVDQATAARTINELEKEIGHLKVLENDAGAMVRTYPPPDRKWDELSKILQDSPEMKDREGNRRKLIVFTEHRDTLTYLTKRIDDFLGGGGQVVAIHGGVKREDRRAIQEAFREDPRVSVLVATDAAGEGVNLQKANLLINYDLPWNPNRLEQRFGRIHRIGQTEICYMWNLVAQGTREGDVFLCLFEKIAREREALGGRVFDVLGEALEEYSLKKLIIDAIRNPAEIPSIIGEFDVALGFERLKDIIDRTALATETMTADRLYKVKEEMAKAEARKLQPHYIRSFFQHAFGKLGGRMNPREAGRFEITHVPGALMARKKVLGPRRSIVERYQRVCFDKESITVEGKPGNATIIHPGHPLMDAVIDLLLDERGELLRSGTILVDEADEGTEPRVMLLLDHSITDATTGHGGAAHAISRRMVFVHVDKVGNVTLGGHAPYLDYRPPTPQEIDAARSLLDEGWITRDIEATGLRHAINALVPEHLQEVKSRREKEVDKTLQATHQRLTREIAYWANRAAELEEQVSAGRQPKMQPENARKRAEAADLRLKIRTRELEEMRHVSSQKPFVVGGALVVPKGFFDRAFGTPGVFSQDAEARSRIEKLAMDAVMKAEIALGNRPEDVSAKKDGWDILSHGKEGEIRHIEVKGRAKGAETITVTRNEILACLNRRENYLLAIVIVDGENTDGPHYIPAPFSQEPEFYVTSQNVDIRRLLSGAK